MLKYCLEFFESVEDKLISSVEQLEAAGDRHMKHVTFKTNQTQGQLEEYFKNQITRTVEE